MVREEERVGGLVTNAVLSRAIGTHAGYGQVYNVAPSVSLLQAWLVSTTFHGTAVTDFICLISLFGALFTDLLGLRGHSTGRE